MVRTKFKNKPRKTRTRTSNAYQDYTLTQTYRLALLGARDCDLCDFFEIDNTTLDYWKKTKPDFMAALKRGKMEFDTKVAETLSRRAMGYEVEEMEESEHMTKYGIVTLRKKTKKHIQPDVTAIIFWLKNRQRELWTDVNKMEITGSIKQANNAEMNLDILTPAEKDFLKSISIKKLAPLHGISSN